jgi:hypothetical protein
MILLSELSRRRIRSIQKLIRVGRNEVVVVLRVDKEKGALSYFLHPIERDAYLDAQVISISQNVEFRPKTLQNAKNGTQNLKRSHQSCDMSPRAAPVQS